MEEQGQVRERSLHGGAHSIIADATGRLRGLAGIELTPLDCSGTVWCDGALQPLGLD